MQNTHLYCRCKFVNLYSATHSATTVKSEIWSRKFSPAGHGIKIDMPSFSRECSLSSLIG